MNCGLRRHRLCDEFLVSNLLPFSRVRHSYVGLYVENVAFGGLVGQRDGSGPKRLLLVASSERNVKQVFPGLHSLMDNFVPVGFPLIDISKDGGKVAVKKASFDYSDVLKSKPTFFINKEIAFAHLLATNAKMTFSPSACGRSVPPRSPPARYED